MQRRLRWRAVGAALVLAATASGAAVASSALPAGAQATSSAALINVRAGDILQQGYHRLPIVAVTGTNGAAGFVATVSDAASPTKTFQISVAPPTGGTLAAGPELATEEVASATKAKLVIAQTVATAAVCNDTAGKVKIDDLAVDGSNNVTRLAMTFSMQCLPLEFQPLSSGHLYFAEPDGPIGSPTLGEFYPMTPKRLIDTRDSGALGAGGTVNVQVAGGSSTVPANAMAVVLNVTAVSPTQQTFITAYPTGEDRPLASNVNPAKDDIVPNLATVKVGSGGNVTLYNAVGTTNAIVDVMGYFLPDDGGTAGGRFVGQTPVRVLDSRGGTPFGPGEIRSITVDGTATAAVLNVTADQPSVDTYLTVFPDAQPSPPTASNLNVKSGQPPIANLVVVQLDAGKAKVYNNSGNTHVVVDVVGVFKTAGATDTPGRFRPVTPTRVYDTRNPAPQGSEVTTPIPSATVRDVGILGLAGAYPFEYKGVVANLTVTNTTQGGYLTAYPAGTSTPLASNLNWSATETRPNLTMVGTDSYGFNSFYNAAGSTDLIIDVAGWFTR